MGFLIDQFVRELLKKVVREKETVTENPDCQKSGGVSRKELQFVKSVAAQKRYLPENLLEN